LLLVSLLLLLTRLLLPRLLLLTRGWRLRLGHAIQVRRRRRAFQRDADLRSFLCLRGLRAFWGGDVPVRRLLVSGVVLDVHDAALRIQRRRGLPLPLAAALAAAPAATPAVAPELPPALAFLLLALALALAELRIAAVAAATGLRVARVPRLGSIAPGGLGSSRGGGSLSFSVHP
jgi:hypothetical protein